MKRERWFCPFCGRLTYLLKSGVFVTHYYLDHDPDLPISAKPTRRVCPRSRTSPYRFDDGEKR